MRSSSSRRVTRGALVAACTAAATTGLPLAAGALPGFGTFDFVPTAVTPACLINPGGDHPFTFPSDLGVLCTSTSLEPVLADINSPFIVGSFDGTPPSTETFGSSFDAWNAAHGAEFGGLWSIVNGGPLDVTFDIVDHAAANFRLGGIAPFRIGVHFNPGYSGPTLKQLVWSQAIYASYDVPDAVDIIDNTMDAFVTGKFIGPCVPIPPGNSTVHNTSASNIPPNPHDPGYCAPIVPYQYDGKRFFDKPAGPWPDESFRAIALLSTVTLFTDEHNQVYKRELTVYNGVSWGFDLSAELPGAPEPATWVLLATGIGVLAIVQRRRSARERRLSGGGA